MFDLQSLVSGNVKCTCKSAHQTMPKTKLIDTQVMYLYNFHQDEPIYIHIAKNQIVHVNKHTISTTCSS